jgi:hypothetical protein
MNNDKLPEKPRGTEPAPIRPDVGPVKGDRAPDPGPAARTMPTKPDVSEASPRGTGFEGEQIPRPDARRPSADVRDGYVRMRIRVEDGQMSVVDSTFVPGPFRAPGSLAGDTFYQVTDGERMLQAESIPDLGVVRGFANPDGPLEQRRHHIYRPSSYEFDVRIPADELTGRRLPAVSVVLYRAPASIAVPDLTEEPLDRRLSEQGLEELGRIDGLAVEDLPIQIGSQAGRRKYPGTA